MNRIIRQFFYLASFLILTTYSLDAKEIFQDFPITQPREFPYRSPTQRFLGVHNWNSIAESLTMVHRNLFDRISCREEIGFVGYHGSSQEFRIYQDIIRLILEEIVGLPIREDFHFFRIPGDPLYSYRNLTEWGSQGYDPTRFVCMNYAIYGNYNNYGSSSYYYFTINSSSSFLAYEKMIQPLFARLEITPENISPLFAVGRKHIGQENGVIYQVFDMSHEDLRKPYYQLADSHCLSYGSTLPFSAVVKGTNPTPFPNQSRMLMSNTTTLNPYSSLVIKRFDKLTPEVTEAYINDLRKAVLSLGFSQDKVDAYRAELLQLWSENDE